MNKAPKAGVEVIYRNKVYRTGNRRLGLVELYRDKKFVRVVSIKSIKRIAEKYPVFWKGKLEYESKL